ELGLQHRRVREAQLGGVADEFVLEPSLYEFWNDFAIDRVIYQTREASLEHDPAKQRPGYPAQLIARDHRSALSGQFGRHRARAGNGYLHGCKSVCLLCFIAHKNDFARMLTSKTFDFRGHARCDHADDLSASVALRHSLDRGKQGWSNAAQLGASAARQEAHDVCIRW